MENPPDTSLPSGYLPSYPSTLPSWLQYTARLLSALFWYASITCPVSSTGKTSLTGSRTIGAPYAATGRSPRQLLEEAPGRVLYACASACLSKTSSLTDVWSNPNPSRYTGTPVGSPSSLTSLLLIYIEADEACLQLAKRYGVSSKI